MSNLKKILYSLSLVVMVSGMFGLIKGGNSYAAVNPLDDFCNEVKTNGIYDAEANTVCDSNNVDKVRGGFGAGLLDKNGFVSRIINFISFLTGFLAVIFIIVGGLQFTFSGGDVEKAKKARKMILYALVGVGVTVASNVILQFAISIANG